MAALLPGIEPETAAYLAQFAAMPPRENQTLDDLRDGYKAELIRCAPVVTAEISVQTLSIPGAAGAMAARLYGPAAARTGGALLVYVHGGGFAVGDLESHDGLVRLIAAASGLRVLTLDYRRAPEAPFPAARDDVLAAVRWALIRRASSWAAKVPARPMPWRRRWPCASVTPRRRPCG
jgi:acetyl esterase